MRYRILKITSGDSVLFYPQYKGFLFWKYFTNPFVDSIYCCNSYYSFDSEKEAHLYIIEEINKRYNKRNNFPDLIMQTVYLTRRNLKALLLKLDANASGDSSQCTIIKNDTNHPKYPCSDSIKVVAVEDEEYYTERTAGEMHPREENQLDTIRIKL